MMPNPVLSYQGAGAVRGRPMVSILERLFFFAFGIVLPSVCYFVFAVVIPALINAVTFVFWMTILPVIALGGKPQVPLMDERLYPFEPRWQSGGWDRYITFIPDGRAGFAFLPLIIYSTASLAIFIFKPQVARVFSVRLGLYTGVILYAQYSVIQAAALNDPQPTVSMAFIVTLIIGLGSCLFFFYLFRMINACVRRATNSPFGALVAVLVFVGLLLAFSQVYLPVPTPGYSGNQTLIKAIYAVLVFAPAWTAGAFTRAALVAARVSNQAHFQRQHAVILIASSVCWLASYIIAWKMSIANAAVLYAALPLSR